jgi:hypothetical protein
VNVLTRMRARVDHLHVRAVRWIDRSAVLLGAPQSMAPMRGETNGAALHRPGSPAGGGTADSAPGAYVWRAAANRRLHEVMRLAEGVARPYIGDPDIDQAVERLFTLIAAIQELLDLIESEGRRIAEGRA